MAVLCHLARLAYEAAGMGSSPELEHYSARVSFVGAISPTSLCSSLGTFVAPSRALVPVRALEMCGVLDGHAFRIHQRPKQRPQLCSVCCGPQAPAESTRRVPRSLYRRKSPRLAVHEAPHFGGGTPPPHCASYRRCMCEGDKGKPVRMAGVTTSRSDPTCPARRQTRPADKRLWTGPLEDRPFLDKRFCSLYFEAKSGQVVGLRGHGCIRWEGASEAAPEPHTSVSHSGGDR